MKVLITKIEQGIDQVFIIEILCQLSDEKTPFKKNTLKIKLKKLRNLKDMDPFHYGYNFRG